MEEDASIKTAPVTRLRRRLSVEQPDDVKSHSAPSTPTKKRGGRIANKPQLELIDEHSMDSIPKRATRKAAAKELNDTNEEKPITPSRRSARIKSNTSLVSDTPLVTDSPRAKRAARRNSQIGSDSETPLTPARQSRRTRKDSSSSIDKLDTTISKSTTIKEPIAEELEQNEEVNKPENPSNGSIRKSPRLMKKKKSISSLSDSENSSIFQDKLNTSLNIKELQIVLESVANVSLHSENNGNTSPQKETNYDNTSDSTLNLIKNLEDVPLKTFANMNKSTSALAQNNNFKHKRNRTKSLTSATESIFRNDNFYSDNEMTKKKLKYNKPVTPDHLKSNSVFQHDIPSSDVQATQHEVILNKSTASKDKSDNEYSSTSYPINVADKKSKEQFDNSEEKSGMGNINNPLKLFEKGPMATVQSVVYFDDSDTDSRKCNNKQFESEDQCVPVVNNNFEIDQKLLEDGNGAKSDENNIFSANKANENPLDNISCEPMDIDETMPTNVSITNFSNNQLEPYINKPLESEQLENIDNKNNKSKQESLSLSQSQNKDQCENENKSTLILSQLKEFSTENSISKSPKPNEVLSKSLCTDVPKEKEKDKKNISVDYMTSTPLQQKNLKKLGMQINSSIINNSNSEVKKITSKNKMKLQESRMQADSSEESGSEHESGSSSKMLDDEAEEASLDYESGDSQDEEEKQYERENEILEKGETLNSDDDDSDDTDYEKDSFVVSSDEEDDELLSGSGDDLSMSDKELSMSTKSKMKYNERKKKEQKKASKEMFDARHSVSTDNSKKFVRKKNRLRLESSHDSDEEVLGVSKNNRRLRLNSSHECTSQDPSKQNNLHTQNNNVSFSESLRDSNITMEREITTICNESMLERKDPLTIEVKQEPETPQNKLNITCVPIIDKIEEVQIDENMSINKTNEPIDPLKAAESDSDSSVSEALEIMDDYNSLLNKLNKDTKDKKIKSLDMSLNLNKKAKKNTVEPIINQLNITQTKSKKKSKKPSTLISEDIVQKQESKNECDDTSSDSIDLHLLFSENSTNDTNSEENLQKRDTENYIPLKRTNGKTNIIEANEETETDQNKADVNLSQDTSTKKRKKNKKSILDNSDKIEAKTEENYDVYMFIDKEGDLGYKSGTNKAKKKKKNSISKDSRESDAVDGVKLNDSNKEDVSLNNSFKKEKKINNKSVVSDTDHALANAGTEFVQDKTDVNTSLNTSTKKKMKNKSVLDNTEETEAKTEIYNDVFTDTGNLEDMTVSTSTKKKKKKHSYNENSEQSDAMLLQDDVLKDNDSNKGDMSLNYNTKKEKKIAKNNTSFASDTDHTLDNVNGSDMVVKSNKKKKKKNNKSIEKNIELDDAKLGNEYSASMSIDKESNKDVSLLSSSMSKKKKKNNISIDNVENSDEIMEIEKDVSIDTAGNQSQSSLTSSSKRKKKTVSLFNDSKIDHTHKTDINEPIETDDVKNQSIPDKNNTQASETSIKKNKKIKGVDSQHEDDEAPVDVPYKSHKNKSIEKSAESQINTNTKKKHSFTETEISDNIDSTTDEKLCNRSDTQTKGEKKKEDSFLMSQNEQILDPEAVASEDNIINSKKRKRKLSANSIPVNVVVQDDQNKLMTAEPLAEGSQKKKRKLSQNESGHKENVTVKNESEQLSKSKGNLMSDKKDSYAENLDTSKEKEISRKKDRKKRKNRDDDDTDKTSKVFKLNSSDKINVPRLPTSILSQLEDGPKKDVVEIKKANVISTTQFVVEETRKRRIKPSNYLEESVYLNDSHEVRKQKGNLKIPKVLPFVPTATTSGSGFTTKFQINIIPRETKFVAQTTNVNNFKNDYLYGKKIKRLGTYEMYKKQRNVKLSKF